MFETEKNKAKPGHDEDREANSIHFSRIERKLSVLIVLISVQTLLLAALMLVYLIPKFLLFLQVGLVMAAIIAAIYFFRKQIPGWLGNASRYVYSFLDNAGRKV